MKNSDKFTDQEYLSNEQYHTDKNLNARIALHQRYSVSKQEFRAWIFSLMRTLPENSQILELGCGPGSLWQINFAQVPPSWSLVLSDFSPGMIESARQNLAGLCLNTRFKVIDAQEIPFEDETFDAVIANHMIYHIPDRLKALAEMRRVLKPDGKLFAVTNGLQHMVEMRQLVKSLDPNADMDNIARVFCLENGEEQLTPYFSEIVLERGEAGGLVVTETQPLVDYILSMKRSTVIEENPQIAFDAIQKVIEAEGAFKISSDAGMFIATK